MPTATRTASTRRARLGVSGMFFVNGVLFSSLLPRYPEFKTAFGLSNASFGLVVIAFPVGSLTAAGFAAPIIRRFGTLSTNTVASVAFAGSFVVAGESRAVWAFALGLALAGAFDAVVDAAQNVHGVAVEDAYGRSIMNSFHAVWSAGAATGGAIGAAGAATHLPPGPQTMINGVVWSLAAVVACRVATLPGDATPGHNVARAASPDPAPAGTAVWRLLAPLVVLAICGTLVEDVANNWAVLYLDKIAGAPTVIAALTLTAVLIAQFIGRLVGDPMTDRYGAGTVASIGGALVTVGALLIMFSTTYPPAYVGFALTGFGCATLVPAAFAGAGRVHGLRHGSGIALLGWLMRLGFLITSPSVGWLSELTNLRTAMLIPAAAGVLASLLARRHLNNAVAT